MPSRYVYLINQEGKEIRGRARVHAGDGTGRGHMESGDVEELRWESMQLMTEMVVMREEMRKLKETVVGLQMSQSVLISHHNAHTALLEQHRQALVTLTSHPPTPSDGATPSEEDGMHLLSMPPSHFRLSHSCQPQ